MKKISLLVLATVLTSYNVHAIPPPPPLPPAIGSLKAKLKVLLRVTDRTKCDGYFCEQKIETCEMEVKVPVVPGSEYDEGFSAPSARSADGEYFDCQKSAVGYNHHIGISLYATLNAETGTLKIVNGIRSGKNSASSDLAVDNAGAKVTEVSASSPSLKIKDRLLSQIHNDGEKKIRTSVSKTSMSVDAELDFASLTVEAP